MRGADTDDTLMQALRTLFAGAVEAGYGRGHGRGLTRIPHAAEHIPHRVPSTGTLTRHGRSASVCVHEEAVIQGS